jgi:GNAT superfamily N-acetyltransferase
MPADGDQVVALYLETMRWHADRWPGDIRAVDEAGLRSMLVPQLSEQDANGCFRVAELAGTVVGLISASVSPAPSGGLNLYRGPVVWIGDVVVTESARRQGIGSMLMAAVEAWAVRQNAASITLSVHSGNGVAHNLYERNGFRETDIHMRKDL